MDLLFKEANRRSFEYFQAAEDLKAFLRTSDLKMVPSLVEEHPAIQLCNTFKGNLEEFQFKLVIALRKGGYGPELMPQLLAMNVAPVPTLQALYREEKRSIRRVHTLGRIGSQFKLWLDNEH